MVCSRFVGAVQEIVERCTSVAADVHGVYVEVVRVADLRCSGYVDDRSERRRPRGIVPIGDDGCVLPGVSGRSDLQEVAGPIIGVGLLDAGTDIAPVPARWEREVLVVESAVRELDRMTARWWQVIKLGCLALGTMEVGIVAYVNGIVSARKRLPGRRCRCRESESRCCGEEEAKSGDDGSSMHLEDFYFDGRLLLVLCLLRCLLLEGDFAF